MKFTIKEEKLYINNKPLKMNYFLFKEELGHGENAHAFLIYNSTLAREEVLKIWIPRHNRNIVDINRFLGEVQKNAKFNHLGIASIYEANIIDNLFYCRMQYIPGITLDKYLEKNQLFVFRYQYLKQILNILKDVYDAGYFHGDLHSKNVLINSEIDKAFIIDFGTSIFSGIEKSQKRDATLLAKLCYELVPELSKLYYITPSIIEKGSKILNMIMIYNLDILWSLETSDIRSLDAYSLMERFVIPLDIFREENEDLNMTLVIKFFNKLALTSEQVRTLKLYNISEKFLKGYSTTP